MVMSSKIAREEAQAGNMMTQIALMNERTNNNILRSEANKVIDSQNKELKRLESIIYQQKDKIETIEGHLKIREEQLLEALHKHRDEFVKTCEQRAIVAGLKAVIRATLKELRKIDPNNKMLDRKERQIHFKEYSDNQISGINREQDYFGKQRVNIKTDMTEVF